MADYIPSYTVEPDYDFLAGYDKDFDNLPTSQERSRSEGVLGFFTNLIGTTGNVLSSYFASKRPGDTYYVTPQKDKSSNMFLIVGVAAFALIVLLKKKK